jgi:hypothetical protein
MKQTTNHWHRFKDYEIQVFFSIKGAGQCSRAGGGGGGAEGLFRVSRASCKDKHQIWSCVCRFTSLYLSLIHITSEMCWAGGLQHI